MTRIAPLTGGDGNDVYVWDAAPTGGGVATITDFQLPTSGSTATSVRDTIELDGLGLNFADAGNNGFGAVLVATGTLAGDDDIAVTDDVVIMNNQTYSSLSAAATDIAAGAAAGTGDLVFFWADSFNRIHLAYTTDRNTAGSAIDLAILQNATMTDIVGVVTNTTMSNLFDVA